jgi:alginate O-acetyltransferase complex protein AlgI
MVFGFSVIFAREGFSKTRKDGSFGHPVRRFPLGILDLGKYRQDPGPPSLPLPATDMLFTTWTFAALLLPTLFLFFCGPGRGRQEVQIGILVAASLIFYAYDVPALLFLLVVSILLNGGISLRIVQRQEEGRPTRGWVAVGVGANLLILGFFKYAGFLARAFLPQGLLPDLVDLLEGIPLPVGVSFFTFQAISLLVDLGKGESQRMAGLTGLIRDGKRWKALHRIGFFIAFFPQLIAGPIVKAHDFFYQIGPRRMSDIPWEFAIKTLVKGLFLKMVVADNLKEVTVLLRTDDGAERLDTLFRIYGYSFQIFADFAGYSLIAIGLAALFGYRLPVNFRFPYLSASITEFWRRWHISLSSWLKEYLYIPLGGNRRGRLRTYGNLMIVMLLGGLWHGAAWGYLVWGGLHGIFLALERLAGRGGEMKSGPLIRFVRMVLVFHLVSLLWVFFVRPDFGSVMDLAQGWAAGKWVLSAKTFYAVVLFSFPVVLYHLWAALVEWKPRIEGWGGPGMRWWGYAFLLFLIVTNSGATGEFIYFQF